MRTLKPYKKFNEDYDMNFDEGDISDETAKMVLSSFIDKTAEYPFTFTEEKLRKAFEEVADEQEVDDNERREFVLDSIGDALKEMSKAYEEFKKKGVKLHRKKGK